MTRLPFNYDKWRLRSDLDDIDDAERKRRRNEDLAERADYERDRQRDEPDDQGGVDFGDSE